MFVMEIMTLVSCGLLLIPPFLRNFMNRFEKLQEGSRFLILALGIWGFFVAFLTFLSAAIASKTFEECRNLPAAGSCARMQAAISITFIVSFATMGSFLLIFLGSIIPRDVAVTTYLRGLGRAATLAAARAQTGQVIDHHGFESIPLDVVVQTNRTITSEWSTKIENSKLDSPIAPRNSVRSSIDSLDNFLREEREDFGALHDDSAKGLDAMEII